MPPAAARRAVTWNYTSDATSTDYSFTGTDGNTWVANNNAWAPTAGPQTIYVNNNNDWEVVSTQTYDTEYYVESYPYIRWSGSAPISSYSSIVGTTSETNPGYGSTMQWEAAWQIYLASTPGADNGWAFMVWTDTANVSPGGSSTPVTIAGVSYDWYDPGSYDGNHVLVRTSNTPSGCVTDILACITWAVANAANPPTGGMSAALSTIEFGFEIWGTGGTAQTFTCSGCTLAFDGSSGPSVTTSSLPDATAGDAYSETLAATGGTPPCTWSISSGSLPSWASLNASTGVISGTAASGSPATITRGQKSGLASTSGSSAPAGPAVVTWPSSPAAGSKVLVAVAISDYEVITSVKDNGVTQSTFTADVVEGQSGNDSVYIYRADGITLPGSGAYEVTIELSESQWVTAGGIAYEGVQAGGPTASNAATNTNTTAVTGSVTPDAAGALFFALFTDSSGSSSETITLGGSGWTEQFTQVNNVTTQDAGIADQIASGGPSATSATWTFSPSGDGWNAGIACYDAGGGGSTSFTVKVTDADSRTATQALTLDVVSPETASGSDTGSGADSGSVTAAAGASDAGSGADAGAARLSVADTGSGADASSLAASLPGTDLATGTDTSAITAAVTGADTGAGADAAAAVPGTTGYDTGSGTDSGLVTGATVTAADTGTGAGASAITATLPAAADSGAGADVAVVGIISGDTGTGADLAAQAPYVAPPVALWRAADKLSKSGGTMG